MALLNVADEVLPTLRATFPVAFPVLYTILLELIAALPVFLTTFDPVLTVLQLVRTKLKKKNKLSLVVILNIITPS